MNTYNVTLRCMVWQYHDMEIQANNAKEAREKIQAGIDNGEMDSAYCMIQGNDGPYEDEVEIASVRKI